MEMIVHGKRPAPSSRDAKNKAGGGNNQRRRRRRYYKMPSEEFYIEFRFDDDIGDDMVEVNYDLHFDSIDRYEILSEFVGPSHDVAEAWDRHTGETVAVKRVRCPSDSNGSEEASLCAVAREAMCLHACHGHPNILQLRGGFIAADDSTGDLFIVTEQLLGSVGGGTTLRSRLTTRGAFSEAETRALMRQLLGAAEAMHDAEVTHRDINPDTIVLGAGGGVKLCGFRCAITPAERLVVGEKQPAHPPLGALRYCSPQQLMGLRCYSPPEDVWAIGCVMAELLAGEPLFTADDKDDLFDEAAELTNDVRQFGAEAEVFDGALEGLSLAGRELLASLLAFHADERPTAADALKHRWFAENDVGKAKSRVVRAYIHEIASIGTNS